MQIVGYIRVSSNEQVENGFGLEIQRGQLEEWCAGHGHDLVDIFEDAAVSGSNGLANRVGLLHAMNRLAELDDAGLLVARLDRLARNLIQQEQLLAEVRNLGAEVYTCADAEAEYLRDDPDDPSRRLIRQILGAVNEYERAIIRLRMRRGLEAKKARGGRGSGRPPFGWAADPATHELVEVPTEQAALARMFELNDQRYSLRDIARTLTAEGHRSKSGKVIDPAWVGQLLRREGRSRHQHRYRSVMGPIAPAEPCCPDCGAARGHIHALTCTHARCETCGEWVVGMGTEVGGCWCSATGSVSQWDGSLRGETDALSSMSETVAEVVDGAWPQS